MRPGSLHASYRCVSVPAPAPFTSRINVYDAAIRCGVEIVWCEKRDPEKLCLTPSAATRRARKVLQAIYDWEVA